MLPFPVYFKNSLASLTLTRHGLLSLTLVSLVIYATLTFFSFFFLFVFLETMFGAGIGSQAMFSISQANLLANKRRKYAQSANISKGSGNSVNFQWSPFPVEMTGVSTVVPSASGSKLLVVRNPENESPTRFEIWNQGHVEKEFNIPQSVHGSVYCDGWSVTI
jgi:hypothetical protein